MTFLKGIYAILHKDLLQEIRNKENVSNVLFFGVLISFVFSFAFSTEPVLLRKIAPGLFWMVVLFSASLVLDRSFRTEMQEGTFDILLLQSCNLKALFLGKVCVNALFLMLIQILVALAMFFLYDLDWPAKPFYLLLAFLLGNVGIAGLGTFYGALTAKTQALQVLLPLLLFPMLIPLILSAVHLTEYAFTGNVFLVVNVWIKLLIVFDLVFIVGTLLTIEPLLEG